MRLLEQAAFALQEGAAQGQSWFAATTTSLLHDGTRGAPTS
jgi:hypothetical protein